LCFACSTVGDSSHHCTAKLAAHHHGLHRLIASHGGVCIPLGHNKLYQQAVLISMFYSCGMCGVGILLSLCHPAGKLQWNCLQVDMCKRTASSSLCLPSSHSGQCFLQPIVILPVELLYVVGAAAACVAFVVVSIHVRRLCHELAGTCNSMQGMPARQHQQLFCAFVRFSGLHMGLFLVGR
jgi:hypothetical protein